MAPPRSWLAQVLEELLGNPFDGSAREPPPARAGHLGDAPGTLAALLARGEVAQAERLVLAVGHAQACRHPQDPGRVLGRDAVPEAVLARLPRPRGAYLRVVMAAGRCHEALTAIQGASAPMQRVRRDTWAACFGDSLVHALSLERVIRDHDVLLLGETGTGKDAIARAFQLATPGDAGGRPAPAGAVNAAAVPDTLMESELFGHVKGAFTGAGETRMGHLRAAHGGSFFLDEVGDVPLPAQVKLLRVMETNEVYPLGADRSYPADVRYIAATHQDLERMVERGEFRRDLFQRLAGNVIRIPPLRERPEDIHAIGMAFVGPYLAEAEEARARIDAWLRSAEARGHDWPGNVRELQNALRNLLLGLPPGLGTAAPADAPRGAADDVPAAVRAGTANLRAVTDWYLARVLAACGGNCARAARVLGVDRATVKRRAGGRAALGPPSARR